MHYSRARLQEFQPFSAIALVAWILVAPWFANATAFTSNCASPCNWNNGSSWTGGDGTNWPSSSSDTATITANQQVTIPTSVSISVATTTLNAGSNSSSRTTLVINGSLTLSGNIVGNAFMALSMGAGSTLDLNGHNVAPGGDTVYNFTGTSGSHVTVTSGVSGTGIFSGGAFSIIPTWIYVDVSNLGASSVFGRTQTSAGLVSIQNSSFTNMKTFSFDDTGTSANAGFLIQNVDIRAPNDSNPTLHNIYEPFINETAGPGTQQRTFKNATWSSSSATVSGTMSVTSAGVTFDGCVFDNWLINTGAATSTVKNSFLDSTIPQSGNNGLIELPGAKIQSITQNYFYLADQGLSGVAHPISPPGAVNISITNNIFEHRRPQAPC